MITGYNTDVEFNGKTYHVQTEDRRGDRTILESLVYVKGQILDSLTTPYADDLTDRSQEPELAKMLEAQHRQVIRWIRNGRYDPKGIKPFGHGIISDRPFEEVVLEFIQKLAAEEKPEILVKRVGDLEPGQIGALRITVCTDLGRVLRACPVTVHLESVEMEKPKRVFRGKTDAKGTVVAEVHLPDKPEMSLHVLARTELGEEELRVPVQERPDPS